jgi:hypothetical protein
VKNKFIEECKFFLLLVFVLFLVIACSPKNETIRIGLGKSNLTRAGIYEDPISEDSSSESGEKYSREKKFAISDQVEGRWRPGSGGIRKLADSIYVSAMYGEDTDGLWTVITFDDTEIGFELVDHLKSPLIHKLGIPKEQIVFFPSHSHATPAMDPDKYQQAVFNAVSQAKEGSTEVEVASLNLLLGGKDYSINRRVSVKGIASRAVMFNGGCVVHEYYVDATQHILNWVHRMVRPEWKERNNWI